MEGYKYNTEQDAIIGRKLCADFYGLPKNETDTTKYWVDYNEESYNDVVFWYIVFDESIKDVLGTPEEINIKQQDYV